MGNVEMQKSPGGVPHWRLLQKTQWIGTGFLRTEWGLAGEERQLGDTERLPKGEGDWAGENSAGGSDCPATLAVSLRPDLCL